MIINKVCVIGAGTMGSAIAAHVANSNTNVILLDILDQNSTERNNITILAKNKILSAKPQMISHKSQANFIEIGNLSDDLDKIRDCDLVIEAIIEDLEIKHDLYKKITPYLKQGAILSSNTSTIPLSNLKSVLPSEIANKFCITHFFNPVRYMRLLEFVADDSSHNFQSLHDFLEKKMGKVVIKCKDTPGFIANRIGCFLMEVTLRVAIKYSLKPNLIDKIFTKYLGFPRTGIFGLMDLIGLDVMSLIAKSLKKTLDKNDRFVIICNNIPQIESMIANGYNGKKGKGGFYKFSLENGEKKIEILDFTNFEYVNIEDTELNFENINDLINSQDKAGKALREIIIELGSYISSLVSEISDNIYDIDKAMQYGYNWKYGPFQIMNDIINGFLITEQNLPSSYEKKPDYLTKKLYNAINNDEFSSGLNSLAKKTKNLKPVIKNPSANLWHFDDVLCLEIKTKMSCLNIGVFNLILESLDFAEEKALPIIIYSDQDHFSVGADLALIRNMIINKQFNEIEDFVMIGQHAMLSMKYSKVPIISCAKGFALGGGCEFLMHSHYVVANIETYAGLVEMGAGLIPAWGGIKEIFLRFADDNAKFQNIMNMLANTEKTSSAVDFFDSFAIKNFHVNMNIDYLLSEAIEIAKFAKARHYVGNKKSSVKLIDNSKLSFINKYLEDKSLIDENELLQIEKEIFLQLVKRTECVNLINKLIK